MIEQNQELNTPQPANYIGACSEQIAFWMPPPRLILRWGYNKTTIDDIARQAGVAKGTIYLHWKTREELFAALDATRDGWRWPRTSSSASAADPTGATLRGLLKYSALALMQRPLMKAVLLRDLDVIGKLAHSEYNSAAYTERLAGFTSYLEVLREHSLVRTDLSLRYAGVYGKRHFYGVFPGRAAGAGSIGAFRRRARRADGRDRWIARLRPS